MSRSSFGRLMSGFCPSIRSNGLMLHLQKLKIEMRSIRSETFTYIRDNQTHLELRTRTVEDVRWSGGQRITRVPRVALKRSS